MFEAYNTKSNAGDAPTKMVITKGASINTSTNIISTTYALTFQTQATNEEVVNE